jgi:hypothetical protein
MPACVLDLPELPPRSVGIELHLELFQLGFHLVVKVFFFFAIPDKVS